MPIENHPKRKNWGLLMAFERTTSQVLFDNGTHKCISFTSLVKGEGVQANQFLILDNERAAVLDPGGDLTYVPLTMELNRYTRLSNLDYVMASHQDPDIITSMPRWLVYTEAKVVASKLWARFLPHLNSAFMSDRMKGNWLDRLVELPDHGQIIPLGQSSIIAIPAHFYIQSVISNFMTRLPRSCFRVIWGVNGRGCFKATGKFCSAHSKNEGISPALHVQ